MIFPILNGIYSFTKAPVTWCLFIINILVFIFTYVGSEKYQTELEDYMRDPDFSRTQGVIFARFIESNSVRYPAELIDLAKNALASPENEKKRILGGLAMRDTFFLAEGENFEWQGDQVAFQYWKEKFSNMKKVLELHPSYELGLTQDESHFYRLITYQFSHSGFSHLIGNMIFFLIFSTNLEVLIGGLATVLLYLGTGIFAALIFLLLNDASAIPLIGASGSVSGLMAFFCVLMWNRGVRYAFFLFVPKRGFAGLIYLPAWVTLFIWVLSDIAGHWSTPTELGGVAYSAHIGGEIFGILAALILFGFRKLIRKPLMPDPLPIQTKPVFTQYL